MERVKFSDSMCSPDKNWWVLDKMSEGDKIASVPKDVSWAR